MDLFLDMLDKLQKGISGTAGSTLAAYFDPLRQPKNVSILNLF